MSEYEIKTPYVISPEMRARLESDYASHTPKSDQPERYASLCDTAHQFARYICMATPPGRDQRLALTHLENAVFYANAAIARNE